MKIVTVLGTRPEIIRLSRIITKLDESCEHILVHTGQNFDPRLNELFFSELGIRAPDHFLEARGTFGEQVGVIFSGIERLLAGIRPDGLLVLGDTNSGLAAVVAKRMGVPVYHMEAGNRCFDDRVPEEVNRRIIDHSSDVLLPYTERSRQNLLSESIPSNRIFVTGNPIFEVLQHYEHRIGSSTVLDRLAVRRKEFFLVTMHRAENVDVESRLTTLVAALVTLSREFGFPVIVSTHPRTRLRLDACGLSAVGEAVRFVEPFGLFDFISLEQQAFCVLSDSGTVQEECAIFSVPNVTIRDVTERPETLECGSGVLSGADAEGIIRLTRLVTSYAPGWVAPPEYLKQNVSDTVVRLLHGFLNRIRS
jgi:UDP-N-acetylglucosamine 2-epimerase (non-hydrolysing)